MAGRVRAQVVKACTRAPSAATQQLAGTPQRRAFATATGQPPPRHAVLVAAIKQMEASFSLRRCFLLAGTPQRRAFATATGQPPRHAALVAAIKQIEASFGKNAVMRLGERQHGASDLDVISTGSLALDHALGIGGLPRGRVVEIYGAESSGKTTLALHVVAEAQKRGLQCVFIDAEHAIDPHYAAGLGVDLDALFISQPDSGEQALEITDTLVRSGGIDVVVVDSVAALVPKAEIEGEMGDAHMALQARLMSQALRKLTASLSKAKTLIIFINQIRSKVGVVFGSPDVTTGGNALKFYSSLRLEIRKTGVVKAPGQEEATGNTVRVKVAKNKLAPPFRTADFELTYGRGINRAGELVDLGLLHGLLVKAGSWIRVDDPGLVQAINRGLEREEQQQEGGKGAAAPAAGASAPSLTPASALVGGGKKGKSSGKGKGKAGKAEEQVEAPVAAVAEPVTPAAAAPSSSPSASLKLRLVPGEPFAQGRERAKGFFEEHPGAAAAMAQAVKAALAQPAAGAAAGRGGVAGTGAGPAAALGPRPPLSPSSPATLVDDMFSNPSGQEEGLEEKEEDGEEEEAARG